MSPYKPQEGTYEIDRIFPAIGRVRVRTGTNDKRMAGRYELMLESLPLETVRLIAQRKIPIRVAYDAWVIGEANTLPTAQTVRPLAGAWKTWAAENPVSDTENDHREWVLDRLADVPTIGGLPAKVRAWRKNYRAKGAAFNRMRASVMAFLRDELGKRHAVYLDVVAIEALPEPRKVVRHPCSVQEARAVATTLGKKWGPVWWALCCHGLGPKEFWMDGWTPEGNLLHIHGTKRPARERVVPLVESLPRVMGTRGGFAEALERASLGVTPYDARRTYGRWLDDIGVTKYEHDALMGHGPRDMRSLYTSGPLAAAALQRIGDALRAYLLEGVTPLRIAQ